MRELSFKRPSSCLFLEALLSQGRLERLGHDAKSNNVIVTALVLTFDVSELGVRHKIIGFWFERLIQQDLLPYWAGEWHRVMFIDLRGSCLDLFGHKFEVLRRVSLNMRWHRNRRRIFQIILVKLLYYFLFLLLSRSVPTHRHLALRRERHSRLLGYHGFLSSLNLVSQGNLKLVKRRSWRRQVGKLVFCWRTLYFADRRQSVWTFLQSFLDYTLLRLKTFALYLLLIEFFFFSSDYSLVEVLEILISVAFHFSRFPFQRESEHFFF